MRRDSFVILACACVVVPLKRPSDESRRIGSRPWVSSMAFAMSNSFSVVGVSGWRPSDRAARFADELGDVTHARGLRHLVEISTGCLADGGFGDRELDGGTYRMDERARLPPPVP